MRLEWVPRSVISSAAIAAILAWPCVPARAGSFEDAVRARWRGAWVVVGTELYSDCSASYTTNKVNGSFVTQRGGYRFSPGELGKVERVQLKKKMVDLMITLDVPFLVAHQDGPFTLYDRRSCAVSLEVALPRDLTKARDVDSIDEMVATLVERYDTREAALEATGWNGRETEPYPENYESTLARHAVWTAEQTNLAVDQKRQSALEQVKIAGTAIGDDPRYLAGLAAGVEAMRRWPATDCRRLLSRPFDSAKHGVPDEHRADTADETSWRRGWDDGQRLIWGILTLERLAACYVPVPPLPDEARVAMQEVTSTEAPPVDSPR